MKRIFITYGDSNYHNSLLRIKNEAKLTGMFDEVLLYTPEQLPKRFQEYTTRYKRGGGYWLWKPWIIQDALNKANEGDIIVYADAGCTLLKHKDWDYYFSLLKHKKGIFFITSGKSKKWCKQEVFSFFRTKNNLWKYANQIQATFLIIKKTIDNDVINQWCYLATEHPNLFTDVAQEERDKEISAFKEHRHDQSVLTACICTSQSLSKYHLLPEKMEKKHIHGQAVLASRISANATRGVDLSAPSKNPIITFLDNVIVNPFLVFNTRLLFYLSRF